MSKNLYLMAQASIGEDGTANPPYPADQSGWELNCTEWYQHPSNDGWAKVYRFTDPAIAETVAACMEDFVGNGAIGYHTNEPRDTALEEFLAVGMDGTQIENVCTADCSSLVYLAVLKATGVFYDKEAEPIFPLDSKCPRVDSFDKYFGQIAAHGIAFQTFEDDAHLKDSANLMRGDVIRTGPPWGSGHIVVWV